MAIAQMLKMYGGKNATFEKFNFDSSTVTTNQLANNILQHRTFSEEGREMSKAFINNQLQVLWLFNEIMADTSDVNSFVQCTRFTAANSIGSTWGDQIAQEERVRTFIDKYMKNYDTTNEDSEDTKIRKNPKRFQFELFDPDEIKSNRTVSADNASLTASNQGILNISEDLLKLTPDEYMAQMSRNPLAFEQCMMDLTRKAARQLFNRHFPYYTQL